MEDKAVIKGRKRKQLPIDCSTDSGVRATFFCSRCKQPFCEDCIGLEDRKTIYCLACAGIEEIKEEGQNNHRDTKKRISTPLVVVLVLLVITGGYIFIASEQSSRPQREPLPPLTPAQEVDLAKCKENLHALSRLIYEYQLTQGHDPEEIEDVILLEKETSLLLEPVDNNEYGLELVTGKGLVVSCPNPGEHHLDELYAQPGSPPVAVQPEY